MFKNARIVTTNADPLKYHSQKVEDRGKPDYAMSSSDLRLFIGKSPSWWKHGGEIPPSASLEWGSLLDVLVLTPQQFDTRYIIQPENYDSKVLKCPTCGSVTESKECRKCKCDRVETVISKPWNNNSETCQQWVEAQLKAGREVVAAADVEEARKAKARLLADPQILAVLLESDRQVWVEAEWHDEPTGIVVPVRCLIDFAARENCLFPKTLGDLKSTKNATVGAWAKWARTAGYDLQGSWNLDLFNAATGRAMTNFCFILSENEAPYEVGRRYMEADELDMQTDDLIPGRQKYKAAMALYCQCLKTGKWPGYDDTDEASMSGWTKLRPDPYDEQRRMFAPKFQTGEELPPQETEQDDDLTP